MLRTNRQNAAFALDHNVADVVDGGRDEIDEAETAGPAADGFSADASFAEPATREDKPRLPVPGRDALLGARPETVPVVAMGFDLFGCEAINPRPQFRRWE